MFSCVGMYVGVCACFFGCVCIYSFFCMCECTYMYVCIFVCICVCLRSCVYTCVCMRACLIVLACMYERVQACLDMCVSDLPTPPLGQDMTQGQFLSRV